MTQRTTKARCRRPESSRRRGGTKQVSKASRDEPVPSEDLVDEGLEETFPCSDPPSFTVLVRVGAPEK